MKKKCLLIIIFLFIFFIPIPNWQSGIATFYTNWYEDIAPDGICETLVSKKSFLGFETFTRRDWGKCTETPGSLREFWFTIRIPFTKSADDRHELLPHINLFGSRSRHDNKWNGILSFESFYPGEDDYRRGIGIKKGINIDSNMDISIKILYAFFYGCPKHPASRPVGVTTTTCDIPLFWEKLN